MKFTVKYNGAQYSFESGAETYIFEIAILNDMDYKYDMTTIMNFVTFVYDCYLKDDNHTPLGALSDFIADNWDKVKNMNRRDILVKFYKSIS